MFITIRSSPTFRYEYLNIWDKCMSDQTIIVPFLESNRGKVFFVEASFVDTKAYLLLSIPS